VINKHSGWIELQLKPAISTENKSCVTQLQWRPRPGQWCSQGWKFRAVAETCSHYPRRMLLAVAGQLTQEAQIYFQHKDCGASPSNHEQALQTTPQLANTADSWHFGCPRKLRFILKLHVKGDRETALPMQMVVLKCCGVKNSSKDRASPMLSLVKKAQCGLNLSKVPSQTSLISQRRKDH